MMRHFRFSATIPLMLAGLFITGCTGENVSTPAATPPPISRPVPTEVISLPTTNMPSTQAATVGPSPQAATPSPSQTSTTPGPAVCSPPAALTLTMTEGPYYKSGSPERTVLLESGVPGKKITLTGVVLTTDCQPVSGALVDFWQADGEGVYDNTGYVLRGHQYTTSDGRYELVTVVPGEYPGRTEHIHVKVQAPGGPVLTTQVFFPDMTANLTDRIFDPSLVVTVLDTPDGMLAQYNFVVAGGE